jgi:hypothetical protein
MSDLVPMCCRLYKRTQDLDARRKIGQADYPPFGELPASVRRGLPGMQIIDVHGSGWIGRDKIENLGTGHEYGCVVALVPEDFAEAAHAKWPHLISILDETELATFYDTRCMPDDFADDELVDEKVLDKLHKRTFLKKEIGVALTQAEKDAITAALDPDDPAPGVKKNPQKTWARKKAKEGWGARMKAGPITKRPLLPAPQGHVFGRGK